MKVEAPLTQATGLGFLRARLSERAQSRLLLTALFVVAAACHLFSLVRFPPVFVDEAAHASRAWGLLQTGRTAGPLDAGVWENFEGYWTFWPWLGTWIQAQAIGALGLSVFAARLPSLALGLVLLLAVYTIGRRLCNVRTALLAVLLTSFSSAFFTSAHFARHDVMVAALGFGAIALYLTQRTSTFSVGSILTGLAIGLAFEIHVNGAIFGPVLLALHLLDYRGAILRVARFWGFALGTAIGLAFYVQMHLVAYPETVFAIGSLAFGSTKTPPLLTFNPLVLIRSLLQTFIWFLGYSDFRGLLAVVGCVALFRHRSPSAVRLVAILIVLFVEFVALISYKPFYYAILLTPALDLVTAAFLDKLAHPRYQTSLRNAVVAGLVVGTLLFSVLNIVRFNAIDEYQTTTARLRQTIPPGSTIMGSLVPWFGLSDYRYFAWNEWTYYRSYVPGSTLEDAFREYRPDFVVFDKSVDFHISDDPSQFEPWAQLLYIPKTELERFLEKNGQLVAQFETQSFGVVRVYRLKWD